MRTTVLLIGIAISMRTTVLLTGIAVSMRTTETSLFRIRLIYLSGVTCVSVDCFYLWDSIINILQKVTCSRNEISERKKNSIGIKEQSITHSLKSMINF
jgi:hypothetical protein